MLIATNTSKIPLVAVIKTGSAFGLGSSAIERVLAGS
jgi:hypothetical protein